MLTDRRLLEALIDPEVKWGAHEELSEPFMMNAIWVFLNGRPDAVEETIEILKKDDHMAIYEAEKALKKLSMEMDHERIAALKVIEAKRQELMRTPVEELQEKIKQNRELIGNMVGKLYSGILQSEIDTWEGELERRSQNRKRSENEC